MKNRSCLGTARGQGQGRGTVAPCQPVGAAHEACTVHHATTEHARCFEEIMTKSKVTNEFMKFEVTS
jgi:hypothetical protein